MPPGTKKTAAKASLEFLAFLVCARLPRLTAAQLGIMSPWPSPGRDPAAAALGSSHLGICRVGFGRSGRPLSGWDLAALAAAWHVGQVEGSRLFDGELRGAREHADFFGSSDGICRAVYGSHTGLHPTLPTRVAMCAVFVGQNLNSTIAVFLGRRE